MFPFASPLDTSPAGFLLVTGILGVLLIVSAWLDTTRRRLAPDALVISGAGLVAVTLAGLVAAPILALLAILIVWGVALLAYEVGWYCLDRWRRRHPHTAVRAAERAPELGVGAELGSDGDDALIRALRDGSQDTINQSGRRLVERQMNIPPTITIRPGFALRVIVTRDLILDPEGGTAP